MPSVPVLTIDDNDALHWTWDGPEVDTWELMKSNSSTSGFDTDTTLDGSADYYAGTFPTTYYRLLPHCTPALGYDATSNTVYSLTGYHT